MNNEALEQGSIYRELFKYIQKKASERVYGTTGMLRDDILEGIANNEFPGASEYKDKKFIENFLDLIKSDGSVMGDAREILELCAEHPKVRTEVKKLAEDYEAFLKREFKWIN